MVPVECEHTDLLEAGVDHDAVFFRCRACRAVVVVQRGEVWVLRPPAAG